MRFVAALAFVLLANTAWADAGLDLVVLVDRSTSMSGDARLGTLMLRMTLELLARNAATHHVEHRLAVIGFGSAATIDVPFTRVSPRELPALRHRLETLPSGDRGDTDVLAAFVAAEKLFRTLPPDAARRRSVVLLTDGVPYVRNTDMSAYRARLQQFAAERLAASHVSVDVLLAGGSRDPALWQDLARNVHTAPRAAHAVLAEAHGLIAQLIGTRTVESAASKTGATVDALVVPPYLDVVVFDVFRASPRADVEIFPPGSATPVRGGTGGVESLRLGDVLATLVVPRPAPGQWTIRKSRRDARVRILSQQFFPRGTLVRPAPADALRQHDRVAIAYRIVDRGNLPLHDLRGYALSVEISLTRPNGAISRLAMERDPALGPAVFRSSSETECELAGRYWTDVRITTTDAHGRRLEIFRDRWSGFSVAPARRVDCRVSASESVAWLPMTAHIDCPVDVSAIADGSPAELFRALLSRDGRPAEPGLNLRAAGRGKFRGVLCGTWGSGAYQLQFGADRSRLRAPYNVRFVPPRLVFVRRAAIEWMVVPLAAVAAIGGMLLRRRKTRSP